jgi:hypothetical protein
MTIRRHCEFVGSFVHGSYGGPDEAGVTRSRDRLMEELKAGLVNDTDLDVVEIPLHELEQGWIERVDPTKRKLVKSSPHAGRIAWNIQLGVASGLPTTALQHLFAPCLRAVREKAHRRQNLVASGTSYLRSRQ